MILRLCGTCLGALGVISILLDFPERGVVGVVVGGMQAWINLGLLLTDGVYLMGPLRGLNIHGLVFNIMFL